MSKDRYRKVRRALREARAEGKRLRLGRGPAYAVHLAERAKAARRAVTFA